ncbi:MAG TPA: hypothetical protein VFP64_13875 [Pyrinomonadaceae bacterium]|nr:hypothetical protein [Pyrinomonadaceae bacterium]
MLRASFCYNELDVWRQKQVAKIVHGGLPQDLTLSYNNCWLSSVSSLKHWTAARGTRFAQVSRWSMFL